MNYLRPFSSSGTPPKSYGLMVVMRGARFMVVESVSSPVRHSDESES